MFESYATLTIVKHCKNHPNENYFMEGGLMGLFYYFPTEKGSTGDFYALNRTHLQQFIDNYVPMNPKLVKGIEEAYKLLEMTYSIEDNSKLK